MTPAQTAALALLRQYEQAEAEYAKINTMLADLGNTDFPPRVPCMNGGLLESMVALLDAVLGENLASYYLWDGRKNGKITLPDGREFTICSVDDIEAYLGRDVTP